ncbi:hypothetical protein N7457_004072 [Penicillium paradoxum]|uniref:uncharacterized protein n=1 Tax=Penicillium paradoxum TaxID=176176 RepID=UPI002547D4D3|nr:uncharacterized protein N7457_004072 [Penicillium paradoxum]KAJ5782298.1 hypothetical protein N7457_004072 [Penicillium paradoxum]
MSLQQAGSGPLLHQTAAVHLLTNSLYESTRWSTALTNQAHNELGLLQAVLSTTEVYASSLGTDCTHLGVLNKRLQSCHAVLLELQELQLHPDTFGAQSLISDIRARFSSLIFGLSEVNTNMMISSQRNIDRALKCVLDDIRAGKRETDLVWDILNGSSNPGEDKSWARLQEALAAAGISSKLSNENHEFIISNLRKIVEAADLPSITEAQNAQVVVVPESPAQEPAQKSEPWKDWDNEDLLADEPTGLPFLPLPPKGFSYSDRPRSPREQYQQHPETQVIPEENFPIPVLLDYHHPGDTLKVTLEENLPIPVIPSPCKSEKQSIFRDHDLPIPVAPSLSKQEQQTILRENNLPIPVYPPIKRNPTPDLRAFKVSRSHKSHRVSRILWEITSSKTTFITAIMNGHSPTVQILLQKGADVDAQNNEGQTALMAAVSFGHEAIVRLLIEYGADMNKLTLKGESALSTAASRGFERIVRILIASGANIDLGRQMVVVKTPLSQAAAYGQDKVVQLLLDCGAKIDAVGSNGETALAQAAGHGNIKVARLLLDRGALVDHMRCPWQTPLYKAVTADDEPMVQLLMERRADPLLKGGLRRNETVLAYAMRMRRSAILRVFAQYGHHYVDFVPYQYG